MCSERWLVDASSLQLHTRQQEYTVKRSPVFPRGKMMDEAVGWINPFYTRHFSEIIPMLPEQLGEKRMWKKIYVVCIKFAFLSDYITYIQVLYIKWKLRNAASQWCASYKYNCLFNYDTISWNRRIFLFFSPPKRMPELQHNFSTVSCMNTKQLQLQKL